MINFQIQWVSPDAMAAIHSLTVLMRVPIRVKDYALGKETVASAKNMFREYEHDEGSIMDSPYQQ